MSATDIKTNSSWTSTKARARAMVSKVKRRLGRRRKRRPFSDYIPLRETLIAANAAGLSVGEYIERKHSTGPRTPLDQTVDCLESLGVFKARIDHVCEIGPGSGRYLDRTMARCRPSHYEIYETSSEWKKWLVQQYPVVARRCDGRSLAETESDSVDLVQAHKLFVGLPLLNTLSYFREMARVVRDKGWVVFDIMTESCFTEEHLAEWFAANTWEWSWSPHMIARSFAVDLFAERGLSLAGSFQVPLHPAITECMVFRKGRF